MKQYLCIGTYTEPILFGTGEVFQGKGEGLYLCEFEDGQIKVLDLVKMRNPSYFCINEENQKIYAVNEMKEFEGKFGGSVTSVDYSHGKMTVEACFGTMGTDPCHIALSPDRSFLSAANFANGSVSIFAVDQQGNLTGKMQFYQHEGSSVHPIRQKGPHAHGTIFAPQIPLMYVPDLGIDTLKAYRYSNGEIYPDQEADIRVFSGSGPRFGEFSRDGKHFYLISELASSVSHFSWENEKMELKESVCTLPEDFPKDDNICSDLHITPNGKFLYASNRGHDSLCCYKIEADGSLTFQYRKKCGGKTPRNFGIDPLGKYLLVGNQDSDTIVVFTIEEDGMLTELSCIDMPSPVCIRFFETNKIY